MWFSQLSSPSSKRPLRDLILRESPNLLQISCVAILFFLASFWVLVALLLLLLLQVSLGELRLGRRKRKEHRRGKEDEKQKLQEKEEGARRKELLLNLERFDSATLKKLVQREEMARGVALLEGGDWDEGKLDILEEALKASLKS